MQTPPDLVVKSVLFTLLARRNRGQGIRRDGHYALPMGIVLLGIVLGFAALAAIAYWYVGRVQPPAPPDDLRRADDAQLQEMPTPGQVQDGIGEAFGETRPMP
jgi:hypothetical protein